MILRLQFQKQNQLKSAEKDHRRSSRPLKVFHLIQSLFGDLSNLSEDSINTRFAHNLSKEINDEIFLVLLIVRPPQHSQPLLQVFLSRYL